MVRLERNSPVCTVLTLRYHVLLFCLMAVWPVNAGTLNELAIERAEASLPANAKALALNESPRVHWAANEQSVWFREENSLGHRFLRVGLPDGRRDALFDHERIARTLSLAAEQSVEPTALPLHEDSVDLAQRTFEARVSGTLYRCNWADFQCERIARSPIQGAGNCSPNGRFCLSRDNYNVRLDERDSGRTTWLTSDGSQERYYGADVFLERDIGFGLTQSPPVAWSPDSRWAATIRLTVTGVGRTAILDTGDASENPRPRSVSFRYPMLDDTKLPMAELVLVDTETASARLTVSEPWPMPSSAPFTDDPRHSHGWWSADSSRFFWLQIERGNHGISFWSVDVGTGEVRKVLAESSTTRIGSRQGFIDPRNTVASNDSSELIWFSERDGWGHLYLYDAVTGTLKRKLTQGPWLVREVVHVDSRHRWLYFTAGGREVGRNPYYRHLYRASLDGEEIELLTPQNADHHIEASPEGNYFVDTFSRIDSAPRTVIRNLQGGIVVDLVTADLSALQETGWRSPEPFSTLAADGVTPIYGAVFYPRDFDPGRKYALIDDVHPLKRSPDQFQLDAAQAIADLGFIVVTLDARGTSGRSKAFYDAGYGLLAGRLDDHVAVLHGLAAKRPEIDVDRVGVIGHSWGGAAAARAIFLHSETFDVAVASSGTHDMRIAQAWFAESVVGLSDGAAEQLTNFHLAGRLTGKLLLAHGGADYWTHPAHTLRLAQALLAEDKDFDLIFLPQRGHNVPSSPHFRRKAWEFLLRHLGPPLRQ